MLYACVLQQEEYSSRKSLIDLRMQWSCIPLAGIELYKNTLKSEKTNPIIFTLLSLVGMKKK